MMVPCFNHYLLGFGEGSRPPAVSELISQWAPVHERSRMFTLFTSGIILGTVIEIFLSGVLIRNSPIRWPIIFRVFGASGVLWFVAWVFICYNYPDYHPFISDEEEKYSDRLGNTETVQNDSMKSGTRIQQRWVIALMTSFGLLNAYTLRVCLSVAITVMVKSTNQTSNGSISNDDSCPSSESTFESSSNGGTYEWDEETQGVILSSFYMGYIITQIPGGLLAQKYGGKHTMGFAILSTALLNLLTPAVAENYGSTGLIVLRFLMGVFEGPAIPAASLLISKWSPAHDMTKIGTTVMSGVTVGIVVGNGLSGLLIHHSSMGWPIVFYFFGTLSIVWFLAWIFLCFNHPDVHPFISDMEKKYLRETTEGNTSRQNQPIPWRHIMTSVPFLALLGGKAGFIWGANTLVTDLPKYMNNILKFSVQANGLLSSFPYVIQVIVGMVASWISDWLIKTNKMSRTNVRKTLATVASALSAVFLLAASYAGCDRTLVVMYFTVTVSIMAFFVPSIMVNINDLSPNFAGTLMSIANMVGCVTAILAPYVAGLMTTNQALSEWRMFFWINFAIAIFSSLIYLLWADGEVQYWNDIAPPAEKQQEIKPKEEVPFLRNQPELRTP